jgi:hypothetical protein
MLMWLIDIGSNNGSDNDERVYIQWPICCIVGVLMKWCLELISMCLIDIGSNNGSDQNQRVFYSI